MTFPYTFLKIANYIAPIFSVLFNKSVSEGIFPNIFKISGVTPIYKRKSSKIVSNFRPISVLSLLSKILKKLMKNRIMKYLKRNSIIYDKQFGFREGYSTTDAILEFEDSCTTFLMIKFIQLQFSSIYLKHLTL